MMAVTRKKNTHNSYSESEQKLIWTPELILQNVGVKSANNVERDGGASYHQDTTINQMQNEELIYKFGFEFG